MSDSEMNISDHYVDLLERVIEENRKLREEIKNQSHSHQKIFDDFSSRINALSRETESPESSRRGRSKKQTIVVPQVCRQAFRTMYRKMKKGDGFGGFIMNESYSDKANQDVVLKVTQAVFEDHGGQEKCPWSSAQLKAAGATYHKTRKDAYSRAQKNNTEEHKKTCRRQGRLREKLQRRLNTLELMTCGSERRASIKAVLTPEYTSSDESELSESEEGEPTHLKGYLVKKLPCETSTLRKIKKKLDDTYLENLPVRSRRSVLPRRIHPNPSQRPLPSNAPDWAFTQPSPFRRPVGPRPLSTSTPNRSRVN